MNILSSSDILFYGKYILCPIVLCPILVIVSKHASQPGLIELMIAERLYDCEELSTSRVYEFSIIDDALELSEISEPDAGAADTARLFLQDNGSGKTQLCVRFSSGATQVIATQP